MSTVEVVALSNNVDLLETLYSNRLLHAVTSELEQVDFVVGSHKNWVTKKKCRVLFEKQQSCSWVR